MLTGDPPTSMAPSAGTGAPSLINAPKHGHAAGTDAVYEPDSDVERFVDEVLQHSQDGPEPAGAEGSTYGSPDGSQDGSDGASDGVSAGMGAGMGDDGSEGEYYLDPYDVLLSMGVDEFVREQRAAAADPLELFEAFELEVPGGLEGDAGLQWAQLTLDLEDIYSAMARHAGAAADSAASGDDADAGGSGETGPERAARLAAADAYLRELRAHGPVRFAALCEARGTAAPAFLAAIGYGLPRSLQGAPAREQWAFARRFLLRHVYQRPRLEGLCTFEHAVAAVRDARRILVVTGAGISVSCGIPDFRSEHGLYAAIRDRYALPEPECMFDIEFFRADPAPFFDLAKELFPGRFRPSLAHHFLGALEARGQLLRNFTQNIDTLEQVAGLSRVVYCHGSFASATCTGCRHRCGVDELRAQMAAAPVPYCGRCGEGVVKPDIVFFGEPLPAHFDEAIERDVEEADLVIVIGSSMKVQPVSMIPDLVRPAVPQILINRERIDHNFDIELIGDADVVLGELARRLGWPALDTHVLAGLQPPQLQRVLANVTLFNGAPLGMRPEIPDPVLDDGSLFAEALVAPAADGALVGRAVQQMFPKPEQTPSDI